MSSATITVRMIFVRGPGGHWWLWHAEDELGREQSPWGFDRKIRHAEQIYRGAKNVRVVEVEADVEGAT